MSHFEKVKNYILEMGFTLDVENQEEELVMISDEERGIKNLVIDCEDPILILEQVILSMENGPAEAYKKLMQFNRTLVHGAFALTDDGKTVIWRDTLQLENLDHNELEGSIDALSLAMAEYVDDLIALSK